MLKNVGQRILRNVGYFTRPVKGPLFGNTMLKFHKNVLPDTTVNIIIRAVVEEINSP